MNDGTFTLIEFYERRARRILPALFLVILVSIPFSWTFFNLTHMRNFSQSVFAASTFSANILFWMESGYFHPVSELKPLLHTWSLSIEEQYYLLFPLFLLLTSKWSRKFVLALLGIMFFISLGLAQWSVIEHGNTGFYSFPKRAFEILMGVFVGFYLQNSVVIRKFIINQIFSSLGLILIVISFIFFDDQTPFPSIFTLIPIVGTMLIILFAVKKTYVNHFLSNKILVGIGLISYGAYLWHQPLFAFTKYQSLTNLNEFSIISLCLISFFLAYISWKYVETPFRNKEIIKTRYFVTLTLTMFLLFISFGLLGHFSNGFDFRNKQCFFSNASFSDRWLECHSNDNDYIDPKDACEYFGEKTTWAVIGDSHVPEIAYELALVLKKTNESIKHLSYSSCHPSYGVNREKGCGEWTHSSIKMILKAKEITNVLVIYRVASYLYGDHNDTYPSLPQLRNEEEMDALWKGYTNILKELVLHKKNVFLVIQAPEVDPRFLRMSTTNLDKQLNIVGNSLEWWKKRISYVYKRINEIPKEVVIIDPAVKFCNSQSCFVKMNGETLYYDDHHLSLSGAKLVVDDIFKHIESLKHE